MFELRVDNLELTQRLGGRHDFDNAGSSLALLAVPGNQWHTQIPGQGDIQHVRSAHPKHRRQLDVLIPTSLIEGIQMKRNGCGKTRHKS